MALLGAVLWGALTLPAPAQILDIRPDGSTALYKGVVIASPDGVRPLAPRAVHAAFASDSPVMVAIDNAAQRHELSRKLIAAIAWQESRMRQAAVSPKGARGVMQLMPTTARSLGVDAGVLADNVDGGAAYLARLLEQFDGDIIKTLAAYNAGPEAVARYGGVPPFPETQAYVSAVLERMAVGQTEIMP
jgi:soluble lytic murein transglycosylase-like protein